MSEESDKKVHNVTLTDQAAAKAYSLLKQEDRDDLRLRIKVESGGCAGLIYDLYFDEEMNDDDTVREFLGVEVIVDAESAIYLDGATIDFSDTIERQGFSISNPGAAGSCACGGSFH